ncbi:Nif3-like dinuclear metal center hexameric protein [Arsenicicoccus dermatophilus]|uniref:Nif3-like dinuclear metal center hexameric protein n=1 Tax=Arsenicicoccus dermatophilus TaxID=1076331 RepID=UPI001F4D3427|nr:Nif3-like dinuclear metal center hexameric protein [Arsenicicoccus dermatophilus]MCH8612750.1 Nif3-like dinuclear metal center hexameric protein [Arsenicicoccus dermatophilus]
METTPAELRLADVLATLRDLYPEESAQSWDRVGLVTGDPDQPVRRVLLAVDPTLAVIDEAVEGGYDLLVTHHPLLLRGVHSVATTTAKGAAVTRLVVGDVALYCSHTPADVADAGVSQALADALDLRQVEPLVHEEGQPLGRVGELPQEVTLEDLARRLAEVLPPAPVGIRVSGPREARVRRVAVLGGAGDSAFDAVRADGADVYVTADLRHHPALEAREEARAGTPYLVDAGHFATEQLWLPVLRDRLLATHPALEVELSTLVTDPWTFLVPTQGDRP